MATNTNTATRKQTTNDSRVETLEQGLLHELSDILGAERQILKAVPELLNWSSHDDLRKALDEHRAQTEMQVQRLEQVFQSLEHKAEARDCKAMEGIIREARELCGTAANPDVRDAFVIAAAQKVEHYEIASYGTVATWAERLGHDEVVRLLRETLQEEKQADERLTQIAESGVNADARR